MRSSKEKDTNSKILHQERIKQWSKLVNTRQDEMDHTVTVDEALSETLILGEIDGKGKKKEITQSLDINVVNIDGEPDSSDLIWPRVPLEKTKGYRGRCMETRSVDPQY